jgi:hypothetical protein
MGRRLRPAAADDPALAGAVKPAHPLLTTTAESPAPVTSSGTEPRRDEAVAVRLRRVDSRRMALLREMIGTFCSDPDEVEARSLFAFCVAIGEQFLAAGHGDRTRAQVLVRAAGLLLHRPAVTADASSENPTESSPRGARLTAG